MAETPTTWLLNQLKARDMHDLVEQYHVVDRAYQLASRQKNAPKRWRKQDEAEAIKHRERHE